MGIVNTRNVWQTHGIKVRNILKTIRNIIKNFIQYILGNQTIKPAKLNKSLSRTTTFQLGCNPEILK
jgi:hypothetical protein